MRQQTLVRSFSAEHLSAELKGIKRPPMAIAERWFPKPGALEKSAGMHRFVWNLAWGSSGSESGEPQDEDDFFAPHAPRVVSGTYEVRLTVDGKTWTQSLKVAMDPRSTATPEELERQIDLGRQIFAETLHSRQALAEMQSVQKQLSDLKAPHAALKASVEQVQTEIKRILDGGERSGIWIGLKEANSGLAAALGVVESSDRAIPSQAIAVYEQSDQAMKAQVAEWSQLKTGGLKQLNDQLKQAKVTPIAIAEIEQMVEYFMSR